MYNNEVVVFLIDSPLNDTVMTRPFFRAVFFLSLFLPLGFLSAQETPMAQALQPFIDSGQIPGIVSVLATKDQVLQIDSIGYANIEKKTPINPDQLFWIASTTKHITGTALMMLVDEGKVALDDPIEKYLPEMGTNLKVALVNQEGLLVLQTPETKPTVRQAMSHMIGWPFETKLMEQFGADALPLRQEVYAASLTPLVDQPGKEIHYTELGIDVLGAIIENVSGIPYEQFLQERLFDPLGMTSTTFWPSLEDQEKRWIQSYRMDEGVLTPCDPPLMTRPYEDRIHRFPEPGSGLFSTANDLTKFFQMHAGRGVYQGKRYLSEESIQEMRKVQTPSDGPVIYGLATQYLLGWVGHGGALGNLCFVSESGFVKLFIIQSNQLPQTTAAHQTWLLEADKIFKISEDSVTHESSQNETNK